MNKNELIQSLQEFCDPENIISTQLYLLLKSDNAVIVKKADVENSIQDRLTQMFREYTSTKFMNNEDLSYIPLSEFDERKNVVFRFDFPVPEKLNFLNEILLSPVREDFNFNTDNLSELFGYLMVVGNELSKISIFRKHHSFDIVRREKRLYMVKSAKRFVQVQNDGLILDKGFDFMKVHDDLVILNQKTLEKDFGFEEIIEKEHTSSLALLETSGFIHDIEGFKSYSAQNKTFQRSIIKAKNSPVLSIPFKNIYTYISSTESLKGKLKFNESRTAFDLSSAASKKTFIKLLNDDFLNSGLTNIYYDVRAKDKLD